MDTNIQRKYYKSINAKKSTIITSFIVPIFIWSAYFIGAKNQINILITIIVSILPIYFIYYGIVTMLIIKRGKEYTAKIVDDNVSISLKGNATHSLILEINDDIGRYTTIYKYMARRSLNYPSGNCPYEIGECIRVKKLWKYISITND